MQNNTSVISTLVFDWGDTLMVNFPAQKGPMRSWPDVAAVEGASTALAALSSRYQCVLATNASDSRARDVYLALARVGLDGYLKAVFTSGELGFRKPDPRFFRGLQSVFNLDPDQMALIGDDYRTDILGAQLAGWCSIWYNPSGGAAPGLVPTHDAEVLCLSDLPGVLASSILPGFARCLSWLQEQYLSQSLIAHVQAVAAVAYLLAVWLRAAGEPVNPLFAHRGGLLHDLAKLKALESPPEHHIGHTELGARMLKDHGEPLLAECVRRHGLFALIQPELAPRTWEEKLVYLADKLVEGSRVAGLEVRVASLRKRYQADNEKIAAMVPDLFALQAQLCAAMGFPEAELLRRIRTAFNS
jgi:putative nucleotidyltransferase with HDIG domain